MQVQAVVCHEIQKKRPASFDGEDAGQNLFQEESN